MSVQLVDLLNRCSKEESMDDFKLDAVDLGLLKESIAKLIDDKEGMDQLCKSLSPKIESDIEVFYQVSRRVGRLFLHDKISDEFVPQLLSSVLYGEDSKQQEEFFCGVSEVNSHVLFMMSGTLHSCIERVRLPTKIAYELFPKILKIVEGDGASGEIWKLLTAYCHGSPSEALKLYQLCEQNEEELFHGIAAHILGVMRAKHRAGEIEDIESFLKLDENCGLSDNLIHQYIYRSSWVNTLWEGQMNIEDYRRESQELSDDEKLMRAASWLSLQCAYAHEKNPEIAKAAVEWFELHAAPDSPDLEKLDVIRLINMTMRDEPEKAISMLTSILPISEDLMGIWERIFAYFANIVVKHPDEFDTLFTTFIKNSGKPLFKVLDGKGKEHWFISQLKNHPSLSALVTNLLLDADRLTRLIGMVLLEQVKPKLLERELLLAADEPARMRVLFESQIRIQDGWVKGMILSSLAKVEVGGTSYKDELTKEITLQCMNTKACRDFLRGECEEIPLVVSCLKEVDAYFDAVNSIQDSDIVKMQIPGQQQAMREYSRRFSEGISKGMKEHSVLLSLCRTMSIPYGNSSANFQNGVFTASMDMQEHSVSSEIPMLDDIQSEQMALRKSTAIHHLDVLAKPNKEGHGD